MKQEDNITDLERAVNDAMPKQGMMAIHPSYGLCVYVPFEQPDGHIDRQALTLLCGIETMDGVETLNLMEDFRNMAVQNHMAESQLAETMSRSAGRIAAALQYAAKQLKAREES